MSDTVTGEAVWLESSPQPLHLTRIVADVACPCARCSASGTRALIVGADWWDRDAVDRQRDHAGGLVCGQCGAPIELPVPLVQYRRLDAADLVVGLPMSSPAESDRAWISAIMRALGEELDAGPSVVTVRASWWPYVDRLPLGPVLAGLAGPPELPEPPEDRHRWLAATRAALSLPNIPDALARFVASVSVAAAREVAEAEPALLNLRWRATVELAGSRLLDQQETDEQREVVRQRLSRLRRIAIDVDNRDQDRDHLPDDVWRAIDRTVALPHSDPARLAALRETVHLLRPHGHTRMLAAALTSLVAARIADAGRSPSDATELADLTREAADISAEVLGPEHESTVINNMNMLLIHQDRPDLTPDAFTSVANGYERLAANAAVHRTGHLVDALVNLAAATDRRTDLGRGERQELMLRMFEDAEHIARLIQPSDMRTTLLCLANQAAVLRQRIAGPRRPNAERAWSLLDQAWSLEHANQVLHAIERLQLTVNRLNVAYALFADEPPQVTTGELTTTAREVVAAADDVHEDHETAITSLISAGSVLVDLYVRSVNEGQARDALLDEAESLLLSAVQRAERVYPPGHRTRLTARVDLAAVYGAPASTGGGHCDADRCAELLVGVAAEAGDRSPEHAAIAMTNLATLRVGQGRWEDAAQAYGSARRSRRAMVEHTTARHTRLGEVVATRDLAAREALAYARVSRPDQAVAALEESRANLLRHRRGITRASRPGERPGRTVVHLAACGLGNVGVVRRAGHPPRAFIGSMPAAAVRDVLHTLVTAPTRIARLIAFEAAADLLRDLTDLVASLAGDDTEEICVVACVLLAGAPLHAIECSDGRTWTDRWRVRYWPSSTIAAHLGRAHVIRPNRAIAVANPSGDLPLAAAELESVRHITSETATPPDGWSVRNWLQTVLPAADLAHLACHVQADLIDPTGSHFELGPGERLTVANLLDGPDLRHLQLVVASACQAGVPAVDAPDELLGIGFGLVHAGARAAITTLWEVNDTPAALLVARLYKELRRGLEPGAALHHAQRWLAGVDNDTLNRLCSQRRTRPGVAAAWLPAPLADTLGPETAAAEPTTRPFHHPADWGAFTYLGG